MLSLKDIQIYYSDYLVLEDVNVDFKRGSRNLITGGSGSGKSSLAMLIAGLMTEYRGSVMYDDKVLKSNSVAIMFQNPKMQFCMRTVKSELVFVLENMNTDPHLMDELILEACEFSEISHLLHRDLESLSGGEKQCVSLSCIYLMNREIIILDEPFANIDDQKARFILGKILSMQEKQNSMLLIIDHQLKHYEFEFDQIISVDNKTVTVGEISTSSMSKVQDQFRNSCSIQPYLRFEEMSVSKKGKQLFQALTDYVYKGELLAVTGPSGSGKTSLLYALLGINRYQGNILIENKKFKSHKVDLGFVFQNPLDQFIESSVYDEVFQVCRDATETKNILEEFNLWERRDVSPFKLSQGQQRRLALGIILSHDFDLLVLDEPTYGQDMSTALIIMDRIYRHVRKNQQTVIFTSHDQSLVKAYADRELQLEKVYNEENKSKL